MADKQSSARSNEAQIIAQQEFSVNNTTKRFDMEISKNKGSKVKQINRHTLRKQSKIAVNNNSGNDHMFSINLNTSYNPSFQVPNYPANNTNQYGK